MTQKPEETPLRRMIKSAHADLLAVAEIRDLMDDLQPPERERVRQWLWREYFAGHVPEGTDALHPDDPLRNSPERG